MTLGFFWNHHFESTIMKPALEAVAVTTKVFINS